MLESVGAPIRILDVVSHACLFNLSDTVRIAQCLHGWQLCESGLVVVISHCKISLVPKPVTYRVSGDVPVGRLCWIGSLCCLSIMVNRHLSAFSFFYSFDCDGLARTWQWHANLFPVWTLAVMASQVMIVDVLDQSAIAPKVFEEVSKCYPEAKVAHLRVLCVWMCVRVNVCVVYVCVCVCVWFFHFSFFGLHSRARHAALSFLQRSFSWWNLLEGTFLC